MFYVMVRDGLLPALFARVHAKRRTPHVGTLVLGVAIALAAAPGGYSVLGAAIYWLYGSRHSKLAAAAVQPEVAFGQQESV